MDPLATVLAAVVAGSAAALEATAGEAVKDCYNALKRLLANRFSGIDLTKIERDPLAPESRGDVERQLRQCGASADAEVLSRAEGLLEEVARSEPDLVEAIGVDLAGIKAGTIRIEDIVSAGAGVRVKGAIARGDFVVTKVRAGSADKLPGKR